MTVLIGGSRTCLAGCVAFCKKHAKADFKPVWYPRLLRLNAAVTCAEREGVVPGCAEVAVRAVQAELACVTVVAAALSVTSPSAVAIAHPVPVTRPFGTSHASYDQKTETGNSLHSVF